MTFTSPKKHCPYCNTTDTFHKKPKYRVYECRYCGFNAIFKELEKEECICQDD